MSPTEQPLKFQGRRHYPAEDAVDDWGFNPAQVETKVEQFRRHLEARKAWNEHDHDFHTLLRFLRARKYDQDAATFMWQNMLKWREENNVDELLEAFTFPEKEQFLMCYPQGYHKTDKFGRPVYIQHLGNINLEKIKQVTTEERMVKFHIQEYERCIHQILPICSYLQKRQIDQTFGILDIKGVGLSHLTGEVKRILGIITKADQDNYPEMLGHICIINAPFIFKSIWPLIKPLLDARTQEKIEICGSSYTSTLLKWIDEDCLPTYLGGKSKGTLLDDVGPWSDSDTLGRIDFNNMHPRIPAFLLPPEIASRYTSSSLSKAPSHKPAALPPLPEGHPDAVPSATHRTHSPEGNGTIAHYADDEGNFHSPQSDASNTSFSSVYTDPMVDRQRTPSNLSKLGVTHNSQTDNGPTSSSPTTSPSSNGTVGHRTKSLMERIKELELQVAQHKDRLRLHIPDSPHSVASTRSAPEGSLLFRVETLEEGMELLLKAQELSLKDGQMPSKKRSKERCCGGCTTM